MMTGSQTTNRFVTDEERSYTLGLSLLPSFGPRRCSLLCSVFGSAQAAWVATLADLVERGFSPVLASRFITERSAADIETVTQRCRESGIVFCARDDAQYPALLREIPDAPIGLFYRGTLVHSPMALAVVGTRRPSPYGRLVTEQLVDALARQGVLIVSGLAFGVDATAHAAALRSSGTTIAVLAGGCDQVYPTAHTGLAEAIVRHGGAVLSEFPPGSPSLRHHFPIRNRIIAGMAHGVLVTEAPEKSGALLTAKLALDYNRDVFAVPGPITSATSAGTNRLLRDGAQCARHAGDVLSAYQFAPAPETPLTPLSEVEQKVMHCFGAEPLSVDHVVKTSTLETSVVNATLTQLEIKGWIQAIDPLHFIRRR